ncbi:MAG: PAS domain-containing protein [Acidobacteriota bacterium]
MSASLPYRLLANNAAVSQYGYSREEFLSMTIKDIRPEEDVPALEEILARQKDPIWPVRYLARNQLTFPHL